VELKEVQHASYILIGIHKFLMYRVELKALKEYIIEKLEKEVPNVPCGVESRFATIQTARGPNVPNVPCGVESINAICRCGCKQGS